uniref:interleukin-1 receptor type 1-like n=1 Tax=Centroberyx gerrardi TaxID=166262 RepID=UPI003AB0491E
MGEIESYDVSAGHLFLLSCGGSEGRTNVTWTRGGERSLGLPPGAEVRQGELWFLPLLASHNGTYTCQKRDQRGSQEREFRVSVSSGGCPSPAEDRLLTQGVSSALPCKLDQILGLNSTADVRWLKDCSPVEQQVASPYVDRQGNLRLASPSQEDAGIYTCLLDVRLDGRSYTAARSLAVTVNDKPGDLVFSEPAVVFPKQETVMVELGSRVELKCLAYVGFSDDETQMFWTVNGSLSDDHPQLQDSAKYVEDRGRVYGLSTLSISEVLPWFLDVPIRCHVENPSAQDEGLVWLQEADHSGRYTSMALCLASSLAVLALAAGLLFFKVDLVLAYRKLCPHLAKQQTADGKLYDAYVSYLHADGECSSETAAFALQVLPEALEKQHGYSLYIRGRDDCPGEAMHDVIAAAVRQSRRLIIILSAQTPSSTDGRTEEASALHRSQNQLCFEQRVGLHDALTQSGPRVILLEIDGLVDYSSLPESLRYIKRKQGVLKWRRASSSHRLSRSPSNRLFWKSLRYHMPPAPVGRAPTVALTGVP